MLRVRFLTEPAMLPSIPLCTAVIVRRSFSYPVAIAAPVGVFIPPRADTTGGSVFARTDGMPQGDRGSRFSCPLFLSAPLRRALLLLFF